MIEKDGKRDSHLSLVINRFFNITACAKVSGAE
jgi:hypothetical protein